ncbi:MAG: hypothetical protein RL154_304 [Pseudomonadota bacterium]|jgi:hypothetical protein
MAKISIAKLKEIVSIKIDSREIAQQTALIASKIIKENR